MATGSAFAGTDREWPGVDPHTTERALWALAIAFYGIGDLLSTVVGLWLGATEGNPLPALLVGLAPDLAATVLVLTVWKALVMAGFVLLARRLRTVHRLVVPGTLAVLGVVVVAWNTTVLVVGFA